MVQILYERDFLNPSKIQTYTINRKRDEYGHIVQETSLKKMMNSLVDFGDEETLLQYHGQFLGVEVDRTPKCHPEISGKGIKYNWAAAKLYHRWLNIIEKK